jgi:D-3-phosphoglycerate dehydrogenase
LAKKLPVQLKNGGKTDFSNSFLGQNIYGKHIGIVGLGNIGTTVAYSMQKLGNNVSYWSRHSRNSDFSYLELSEIFKQCDIIFITLDINNETKKLITDKMVTSMKTSASLISASGKDIFNHHLVVENCRN